MTAGTDPDRSEDDDNNRMIAETTQSNVDMLPRNDKEACGSRDDLKETRYVGYDRICVCGRQ